MNTIIQQQQRRRQALSERPLCARCGNRVDLRLGGAGRHYWCRDEIKCNARVQWGARGTA